MSLDNNRRAVLTIAALTRLAEMKREIAPGSAFDLVTVEAQERMVINGTVEARDIVLQRYETDGTFEWFSAEAVV
jgi:hypothetical protein